MRAGVVTGTREKERGGNRLAELLFSFIFDSFSKTKSFTFFFRWSRKFSGVVDFCFGRVYYFFLGGGLS